MKSAIKDVKGYSTPNRKNIAELEKQLMELKQKEKMYWNMAKKVKQLEEKSKTIKKQNVSAIQQTVGDEEIEYTKQQIQKVVSDTKKMD